MPTYYYEGFTMMGDARHGDIDAESEEHAAGLIRHKLKLIANRIEDKPFDAKFTNSALNKGDNMKTFDGDQLAGMRLNPEEPPKAPAPAARPKVEQPEPEEKEAPVDRLVFRLNKISDVVRKMENWKKAAKSLKKGEDLPEGQPAVGGATWKIYEENRDAIVQGMIEAAMKQDAGL